MTVTDSALTVWDATKAGQQTKLGELVQYFQTTLPINGNGVPVAYIDPTVIAQILLSVETPDDVTDEIIQQSTTPIEFDEGFPTIGGIPLWERLDGEPVPYYNLFKQYREMKYVQGSRSIAKLSAQSSMLGRHLNALARVYHWQLRTRGYDQFKEYEKSLARQQQVEALESKHAKFANNMLEQATCYLDEHPEQLTPKTAIQLAELAMRVGRLALGLNPDKPGEGGSMHATNITIANTNNHADSVNQINVNTPNDKGGAGAGAGVSDMDHLKDILKVLEYSGALTTPVLSEVAPEATNKQPANIIDMNTEAEAK